jgi:methyl-accepting chemotaxis protein
MKRNGSMNMLTNLTIRTKLTVLIAFATLLMVAIGVAGQWGIYTAQQAAEAIYKDRLVAIGLLNDMRNNQNQIRIFLLAARQETDAFEIMGLTDKVRSQIFKIEQQLDAYRKHKPVGEEKKLLDTFVEARTNFGRTGVLPMIDLLQGEKFAAADTLRHTTLDPAFAKASDAIDAFIQYQTQLAQQQFEQSLQQAKISRIASLASVALGVLLAVIMGMIIGRSIHRGVSMLEKASAQLASGDLTTNIRIVGRDELARVGASFNQMTAQFANLISEVNHSSTQVNQNADALSVTAEQVAQSSRQQSERAAEAANSVEQLNTSFKAIAVTSEEIVSAANTARDLSKHGNKVVASAVQGIEKVARTVSESAVSIADLGQRSNEIGKILSVIKDIADQTNLLALNAAIEAARAGEQGRGFAVVADEVRKLAERTTAATAEISKMIGAIQSDTGQAVDSMRQGSNEVRVGVELANQAGKALQDITRSVEQVVEMIGQIASATRDQSSASDSLTTTVEEIARMAQENSRAIELAATTSQDMVNHSKGLQNVISRFRLQAD